MELLDVARFGWWTRGPGRLVSVASLCLLVAACSGTAAQQAYPEATVNPTTTTAKPSSVNTALSSPTSSSPAQLKLLKTVPEKGPVGTSFTVSGDGLPPGREVDFVWGTWDGSYAVDAGPENVSFLERKFVEKRVSLGRAIIDADGRLNASFIAPEDYGEIHDIYAVVDGQNLAKAGFRILRTASITPLEGRVGTDITVTVKGISQKPYENTMAIRYDNKYTGFVSAVTTRGTAIFKVRAAGRVGQHVIQLTGASGATPYLNLDQSPVAHVPMDFAWTFTVTEDAGPSAPTLDWPDASPMAPPSDAVPRTTSSAGAMNSGVSAALEPAAGPILSQATLRASGLKPGAEVELFWVTARGNRLAPSGWSLLENSLAKVTTGQDGSLDVKFQIPDDLGGWHTVKLVQGGNPVSEVPYFVQRSLVDVWPIRVKAGQTFTVHIKGIGWTELDNAIAVTYDNAYIGYACGFNSNGDITMPLLATGEPGTHLIDLYPTIYRAAGKHPPEYWDFQIPQLTALSDQPGLALGYRLPTFRLAIEIVP